MAIAAQELVGRVDVVHVVHGSECEIVFDPRGIVHKSGNLAHEVKYLTIVGLATATAEVLGGKLSDPDFLVEGIVHVGDIVNEDLRVNGVDMHSDSINMAAAAAGQEVFDPLLAGGSVGAGGGNEVVALVLEWVEVPPPEVCTMLGRHVGLTGLIRFVEAQSAVCVAGLDQFGKVADLLITPQHRATMHADFISVVNTPRAPSIVLVSLPSLEVLDGGVVAQGPSNAGLATTSTASAASTARTAIGASSSGLGCGSLGCSGFGGSSFGGSWVRRGSGCGGTGLATLG